MPLKVVFWRPQNWSRLKPITKALLPPSRDVTEREKGTIPQQYNVFPQEQTEDRLRVL